MKKISKRTPKHLSKAYKTLWDPDLGLDAGVPLEQRIVQDIERVVDKTYLQNFQRHGQVLNTDQYTGRRVKDQ